MLGRIIQRLVWPAVGLAFGLAAAQCARPAGPGHATDQQYSATDRAALLGAVYEAERADTGGLFTNALAIVSFGLAYIGAVLAYVGATSSPNGAVFAFAATPACALMTYHQVMVGMNAARSASASRLEKQIVRVLQFGELTQHVEQKCSLNKPALKPGDFTFGVNVGEEFLNFGKASHSRVWASLATYGAV